MGPLRMLFLLRKEPRLFLHAVMSKIPPCLFPDKMYLKCLYRLRMKQKLNLKNPKTFNEKLQWLKLYDRNPEYARMVDKIEAKKYVAEKIGEEYIIPTLGVWEEPDDIDFDKLPNQFVLKCNHNSGGLFMCKDKSQVSREQFHQIQKRLKKELRYNYYWYSREWPYKNVKRRVLAEKYMEEKNMEGLTDYKLMCFNGAVIYVCVCTERGSSTGTKFTFFSQDWERLPFRQCDSPTSEKEIRKPVQYNQMIHFAELLSKNIAVLRVDFYEINGKLYFGELTFSDSDGLGRFSPEEWDKKLGQLIKLPQRTL